MRLVIRADGGPQIGGGHIVRCLTLAKEAARRNHDVQFIVAAGPMAERVRDAGFAVAALSAEAHMPEVHPPHAGWLEASWQADAAFTAKVVADMQADWLIWDHYGLDWRWVMKARAARAGLRVLALDDLDDRELGSDMVLDPARMGMSARQYSVPAALHGPQFALLRPEFAQLRPAALARRGGPVRRVLIVPGIMDAAGLAPAALRALDGIDLQVEVVMGAASQSVDEVKAMVATNPYWTLTLDATDVGQRMVAADLCIGAGGGTAWERCCMGLPSVVVAVARNQDAGIAVLAEAGAVVTATLDRLRGVVVKAIADAPKLATQAAGLCDGLGARRVLDALEARLRPITVNDARQLFTWRNQPHIRASSHTQTPLVWEDHTIWVTRALQHKETFWRIYQEGGRDIGAVMVTDKGGGICQWSFYIGATDAPRGAGGRMLAMVLSSLADQTDAVMIEGEVLAGNTASVRLHERLRFAQVQSDKDDVLVFRRQICDQQQI